MVALTDQYSQQRAISATLIAVATEIAENNRAYETYALLGWQEPSANWQTRKPHEFGQLLVFRNEDKTIFQAKPERPRSTEDGKVIKYETPKGNGSRAYFPTIDDATRQKIAQAQGAAVPDAGSFWDWVAANPQLPIILTEGPGKSLALLSAGYIAIGLTGVSGGIKANEKDPETGLKTKLEAPELIADLHRFMGLDRPVFFAFDADSKPETVSIVRAALVRLATLVEETGASASIVAWHGRDGKTKGVDDLIAIEGVAAWSRALSQALPFADWQIKTRKISPLTYLTKKRELRLKPVSQIVQVLAEHWGGILAFNLETDSFWLYGQGGWSEMPKELMIQKMMEALQETGVGHGGSLPGSIYELLKCQLSLPKWVERKDLIPFRNGVLHTQTQEFKPHGPGYRLRWQLPYDYDADANCEPIIEWLEFTQKGDKQRVQLLRAYLKAAIMGRNDLQRFIELVGPGGTGKSTFANLVTALVGEQNTCAISLTALETDKFAPARIYGKRLVYVTDSERWARGVSTLKSLTGGDPLTHELKYRAAYDFYPDAMVIICANEPIVSNDYTSGLQRRRFTVPFEVQVPASQQRPLIDFKGGLHGEFVQYLPGLLNWVLALPDAEMENLVKNTAIAVPSLSAVQADILLASNPLADWLDARCVMRPGARSQVGSAQRQRVTKSETSGDSRSWDEYAFAEEWLYPNYREYCDRAQVKAISLRRFSDLLVDLCRSQLGHAGVGKNRDRDGAYITGLALRGDDCNDYPCPITGDATPILFVETQQQSDHGMPLESPIEWRVLPPAERQSAEKLLMLLKSGRGPEDWQPIWFLPGGAEFGDSARAAVISQLRSADWGRRILSDLGLAV